MKNIRSKNTTPELLVRMFLHNNGYRYRLHDKKLPGKPDLVLKKYNTVIFVNGCFWHGHINCKEAKKPKSNSEFWENKIKRNQQRDKKNTNSLIQLGWNVLTIWECQLNKDKIESTLSDIVNKLVE
ncbi:MAG: very short patch repair endonuclease [Mariniphaga sp.]|nr:very short patch repair endonuclease [Mariniphaga sp.]